MFITMDTKKRRPWFEVSEAAAFTCATAVVPLAVEPLYQNVSVMPPMPAGGV